MLIFNFLKWRCILLLSNFDKFLSLFYKLKYNLEEYMCFIVEYIFFLYQSYITVWDHIMVTPHLQNGVTWIITKEL